MLADVYIVGLGISIVQHMTREVEDAIRRSRAVYYVAGGPAVHEFLESLCPRVVNLHVEYKEDGDRLKTYDRMSSIIVDAALDHPPVTFAVYGHPLIYAYPPQQVLLAAKFCGLRAKVLPGISALDTIFVDLALDPSIQGLQMYEATELMIRGRPLQPDVPCLLWQIGSVETNLYSTATSKPERFRRLKEYLLQFYPLEHIVTTVYSSSHSHMSSLLESFPLGEIEQKAPGLHQSLTLYIPPIGVRSVADEVMVDRLVDPKYLNTLVNPVA